MVKRKFVELHDVPLVDVPSEKMRPATVGNVQVLAKSKELNRKKYGKRHKIQLPGPVFGDVGTTALEENFCRIITDLSNEETFGNPVKAYKLAGGRGLAKNHAYPFFQREAVQRRIQQILELQGWNDFSVNAQLLKLIMQNDDNSAKLNAIREYNRLNGRSGAEVQGGGVTVNVLNYIDDNATKSVNGSKIGDTALELQAGGPSLSVGYSEESGEEQSFSDSPSSGQIVFSVQSTDSASESA